jgi:hypothetical protein
MELIDQKGKINTFQLSQSQHQKYIELVRHFQDHWRERNIKEKINSIYDHPIDTTLGPNACFYLLKLYHSKTEF